MRNETIFHKIIDSRAKNYNIKGFNSKYAPKTDEGRHSMAASKSYAERGTQIRRLIGPIQAKETSSYMESGLFFKGRNKELGQLRWNRLLNLPKI
jgi:hypothetical protein